MIQTKTQEKERNQTGEQVKPQKPKPKPRKHNPHYCYLAYFMLVLKFSIEEIHTRPTFKWRQYF